jgi:hypothetical protein
MHEVCVYQKPHLDDVRVWVCEKLNHHLMMFACRYVKSSITNHHQLYVPGVYAYIHAYVCTSVLMSEAQSPSTLRTWCMFEGP